MKKYGFLVKMTYSPEEGKSGFPVANLLQKKYDKT